MKHLRDLICYTEVFPVDGTIVVCYIFYWYVKQNVMCCSWNATLVALRDIKATNRNK